jgi:hypothetical protein
MQTLKYTSAEAAVISAMLYKSGWPSARRLTAVSQSGLEPSPQCSFDHTCSLLLLPWPCGAAAHTRGSPPVVPGVEAHRARQQQRHQTAAQHEQRACCFKRSRSDWRARRSSCCCWRRLPSLHSLCVGTPQDAHMCGTRFLDPPFHEFFPFLSTSTCEGPNRRVSGP